MSTGPTRCFAALAGLGLAAGLAACLAQRARPDVAAELARATGAAEALAIRVEGVPLDEPEPLGAALTLAEALQLALRSAPELQAALARVRAAEAAADQAQLFPNPILDVVLRFPSQGATEIDAGISASLLSFLNRPRRAAAAEDELAASVAQTVTVALDLVAEVRTSYAAAQAGDELAALARERRARFARLLEVARARQAAGEGSAAEATAFEARLVEEDVTLEEHEAQRGRARLALARRIGRPSAAATWALEPLAEPNAGPLAAPLAEEASVARALASRPEVQALRWKLAALGEAAGLARSAVLAEAEVGLAYEKKDGETLGPAVATPLPLFDTGEARRRQAEAERLALRSELVTLERAVVEQVRRARLDCASAHLRLARVRDDLVVIETRRRDQVEELFRAGHTDVTALLMAEERLAEAQTMSVGLAAETTNAWARLERALGPATP